MTSRRKIPDSVRRQVTEDFHHRCAYCGSPAIVGIPMVMDHCIPISAKGSSERDNLCLACYRCNEHKWAKLEAKDPTSNKMAPIFNPRQQQWATHFAWSDDGLYILGKTACGRATVNALHLNSERLISARQIWKLIGIHPPLG